MNQQPNRRLTTLMMGLTVLACAAQVATAGVLADSVTEFSSTQGQDNWQYGYFDKPSSSTFVQAPTWSGSQWVGVDAACKVDASGGHPGDSGDWSVRRWVSEVSGAITITGNLAKADTSGYTGIIGSILVNGVQQWAQTIAGTDGIGVDYNLNLTVAVGDYIDFAIDPNGDNYADATRFTAVITNDAPEQCAAPTLTPATGTYISSIEQPVTLSTRTIGATIRYTTDGSTPSSTAGTVYSGPVIINATTTLNAIAYKSGIADSTVASGVYTISTGWWAHWRPVTLSTATVANDYQVPVELTTSSFDYARCNANGNDLRFTDTNNLVMSYWIESWNVSGRSTLWVKVPNPGTTELRLYYGNASAPAASSGSDTFIYFDDFNRADTANIAASEPSQYAQINAGTWSIESQELKNTGATGDPNKLYVASLGTVSYPAIVRTRVRVNSHDTGTRVGLSSCIGTDGTGYSTLLHTDRTRFGTLNDFVAWGPEWFQSWQVGTWYWMEHVVTDPASGTMKARLWETTGSATGWRDHTFNNPPGRSWGRVGFNGMQDPGDTTCFDDFALRKYAATEPTISLGVEQSFAPPGTMILIR